MATSSFDEFQFQKKAMPVRAWYEAGELRSNGISFDDYRSMGVQQNHKLFFGRRTSAPPLWTQNDSMLRVVVIQYLLRRFTSGNRGRPIRNMNAEQQRAALAEIQQMGERRNTALVLVARRLSEEYADLNNGARARDRRSGRFIKRSARMNLLRVELESIDRCLCTNTGMAAKVVSLVYFYYRVGVDSVEVATRLGLTPPGARQILSRLNRVANHIFPPAQDNLAGTPALPMS